MARSPSSLHRTALAAVVALAGCQTSYLYLGSDVTPGGSASSAASSGASTTTSGSSSGGPVCMPGATQPCYDGPPGTENVGTCKGGMQTCAVDGASWGGCMGEVLPQPANCASGMDLHCVGKVPTCNGNVLWAKRFGDASNQSARAAAVDASGDVVLIGSFTGSVDFGNGVPLAGSPGGSTYVTKLHGADGSYAWANGYSPTGTSANSQMQNVVVDSSGNVIAAGWFVGSIDLGAGTITSAGSQGDAFLLKLDGNTGAYVSSTVFGAAGANVGTSAMAADPAGDLVVGGGYSGSVDFGGGALPSKGSGDALVAMYDASGKLLWLDHFGGPSGAGQVVGVAIDPLGKVLAAGIFAGTIDFGGSAPLVSQGDTDSFVLELDPSSGATTWAERFGAPGATVRATNIATDASGSILVSGALSGGMVDFGCGPVSPVGVDAFLLKLSGSGTCTWSTHLGRGGGSNVVAIGLATDGSSNVVVGGTFTGGVDFGEGSPIMSGGAHDVFVGKLASDGAPLWAYSYGDPNGGQSLATFGFDGLTTDPSGNVLMTGFFSGSFEIGNASLVSAGESDIFVTKLAP